MKIRQPFTVDDTPFVYGEVFPDHGCACCRDCLS